MSICKNSDKLTKVSGFPKCELCALCKETIFKIEPEYLKDEASYGFDISRCEEQGQMSKETKAKLPDLVKKDLLVDTDLLDFPGAKNRLAVMEEYLTNANEAGVSNLVQMLLRGKVAYLFNSYNESRIINILMFCQDSIDVHVNEMYMMIKDWVEKYVGSNARTRQQTIVRCGGISPLFVVTTKFNMDMVETKKEDQDSDAGLDGRWNGRFIKVLYDKSFKANDVDWFKNWDGEGNTFKNTYLLRDYKYSGCTGKGNNLYDGYLESDPNSKETNLVLSGEFYKRLRKTFIANPDVRMFFDDPALAWDVAASMNNDGALYIIDRLTVVAKNMNANRKEQFNSELVDICRRIGSIMREYFVTDDKAELLAENIDKGNKIFREMDGVCQVNPDYFGHLIQNLQVTEAKGFEEFHNLKPKLTSIIMSGPETKQYQLYRERCGKFEGCSTEEDKWQRLMKIYKLPNKEKALQYLEEKNIDYKKLFAGAEVRRRNSSVIAKHMIDKWTDSITDVAFTNSFAGNGKMDEIVLSMLVTSIINTAKNVKLAEVIENEIEPYTDVLGVKNINEKLVSDIVVTKINDFVMNFGYDYLTPEQVETSKHVAAEYELDCFKTIEQKRPENYDEQTLTQLLDKILTDENEFSSSFMTYYNSWLEYMYVALVAHLNVPDYNHEANDKLKAILDELKN